MTGRLLIKKLALSLREKLCRGFIGFFFGLFLQLLIDAPVVTKRIQNLSVARAPEHVLHRHQNFGAPRNRALDDSVRVVRLQSDAHARSAECWRSLASYASF